MRFSVATHPAMFSLAHSRKRWGAASYDTRLPSHLPKLTVLGFVGKSLSSLAAPHRLREWAKENIASLLSLFKFLLPFLFFFATHVHADESRELANQVASAFEKGIQSKQPEHFREVIEKTNALWSHGISTPQLVQLRAQSHTILGEPAEAIRAYREGLQLAPTNEDLWNELQTVYATLGNNSSSNWVNQSPLFRWVSPMQAKWLAIILAGVGWVCVWRWLVIRDRRVLWIGVACVGVGLLSWGIAHYEVERLSDLAKKPCVIVCMESKPRIGNSNDYPYRADVRFIVGEELVLVNRRGEWVQCQNREGVSGWIPQNACLEVRWLGARTER